MDIQFTGSTEINPVLDILATYNIAEVDLTPYGAETDSESEVRVAITGRANKPRIVFTSEPPLSEDQILTILIIGRAQGAETDEEEDEDVQPSGVVAGLISSELESRLTSKLPLDTLKMENWDGEGRGQITAGRYITQWLYLRYKHQFGANEDESTSEVSLELRLTPRFMVEFLYGDAGESALGIYFRRRF